MLRLMHILRLCYKKTERKAQHLGRRQIVQRLQCQVKPTSYFSSLKTYSILFPPILFFLLSFQFEKQKTLSFSSWKSLGNSFNLYYPSCENFRDVSPMFSIFSIPENYLSSDPPISCLDYLTQICHSATIPSFSPIHSLDKISNIYLLSVPSVLTIVLGIHINQKACNIKGRHQSRNRKHEAKNKNTTKQKPNNHNELLQKLK